VREDRLRHRGEGARAAGAGQPAGGGAAAQLRLPPDGQHRVADQGPGHRPGHSASLKSLELSITAPAGETFEFLDTLSIKISADGLEQREIAVLKDVPAQARISLQVVGEVDLLPYINKGATLSATASGHQPART
jgi:hypothetical protein